MNILIVCQYYYPERFLINEIAPALVKAGHSVTVLTGLPNYPSGVLYKGFDHGKRREEYIEGVKVIRCPIIVRGHSKLQLALNYFSFMINASLKVCTLKSDYDIVFLYQLTPIFQALPAIIHSRFHKKKLLCYCLDVAPASGELVLGKYKTIMNLYRAFSRWAYNRFDFTLVTSKQFINYLHDTHDVPLDRLGYLPQHASSDLLEIELSTEKNSCTTFMFAGNHGEGTGLDTILYAAKRAREKSEFPFKVQFVGDGSYKNRLIHLCSELGLDDVVTFRDAVPMDKMPDIYRTADALLITLRPGQLTVPGKLQAYMATGKPILGAMDGSGYDMINEVGCGRCTHAADSSGLAELMLDYIRAPEKWEEAGKNGKIYFEENCTLGLFINKLEQAMEKLIGEGQN